MAKEREDSAREAEERRKYYETKEKELDDMRRRGVEKELKVCVSVMHCLSSLTSGAVHDRSVPVVVVFVLRPLLIFKQPQSQRSPTVAALGRLVAACRSKKSACCERRTRCWRT
jgi:hypothetical protein